MKATKPLNPVLANERAFNTLQMVAISTHSNIFTAAFLSPKPLKDYTSRSLKRQKLLNQGVSGSLGT